MTRLERNRLSRKHLHNARKKTGLNLMLKLLGIIVCWVFLSEPIQPAIHLPDYSNETSDQLNVKKVRLVWEAIPDAVAYQLIITNRPESMNGRTDYEGAFFYNDIYTPGAELDARLFPRLESTWWQVRALNLNREPISQFTDPKRLAEGEFDPSSPFITTYLDKVARVPLYPTYSWIPVLNAASYEVQVFSGPIDPSDGSLLSKLERSYKINGANSFDCYDVAAFTEEGEHWWRVVALDAKGQPIGDWSEVQPFETHQGGYSVAALGDSVTHGGGAISNPPSDPAYDWTSYVGFPVKNLGRSGDTTEAMFARFDRDVMPFHPKILVVMGGINDIRRGTPAIEVINQLAKIREKCRKNNIIPIFLTLTPMNPAIIKRAFNESTSPMWHREWNKVNEWVKRQSYNVDVAPLLMNNDNVVFAKFATDGLHPDTAGKAIIGHAVGDYLRRNFGDYINK